MNTHLHKQNLAQRAADAHSKITSYRLHATIIALAVMSISLVSLTQVYAETPREVYEKAKLAAEEEFAQAILDAKAELNSVKSDPLATDEQIRVAQAQYKQTVADAKELRDQKLDQARLVYNESLSETTTQNTVLEDRKTFAQIVQQAKLDYDQAIAIAEKKLEQRIDDASGDKALIEKAETAYEKEVAEAKQVYNQTIQAAQDEFKRSKA